MSGQSRLAHASSLEQRLALFLPTAVGSLLAATALVAAGAEIVHAVGEGAEPREAFFSLSGLGIALFAVPAVISIIKPQFRIVQVVALLAASLFSVIRAEMITLQPFVWLMCSALLAWHYGYFHPDHSVRTALILAVYLVVWITKIILTAYWQTWSTLPFLVGGFFVMFIVWAVLVLNTRLARDRASDLSDTVEARTVELEEAVKTQRQLILELHHNSKSNLQMISSMLKFEQESLSVSDMQESLGRTQRRVHATARLYESVLSSPEPGAISLKAFLLRLVDDLVMTMPVDDLDHTISIPEDTLVPTEFVMKLGLSINEIAYGMLDRVETIPERHSGFSVTFDAEARNAVLIVSLHFRANHDLSSSQPTLSERAQMGLEIAQGLIESVGGTVSESQDSADTWEFQIPLAEPQEQAAFISMQVHPEP